MKKIVALLATVLTLGISVNSFAAATMLDISGGQVTLPTTDAAKRPALVLKPSANVYFGWEVNAGLSYVILTTHVSGSFMYGTSSGDTNIFRVPSVATVSGNTITVALSGAGVTGLPAAPSGPGLAADWTGWTAAK